MSEGRTPPQRGTATTRESGFDPALLPDCLRLHRTEPQIKAAGPAAGGDPGAIAQLPVPRNDLSTDLSTDRALADAMFVHGLLAHLGADDAANRDRRVKAVMAALTPRDLRIGGRSVLLPRDRLHAAPLAAAAMLLLAVGALSIFMARSEQSASALVQRSIAASGGLGDRTYAVTTEFDHAGQFRLPPARLDVRDRRHQLFEATLPDGRRVIAGHDDEGRWIMWPDGRVERRGGRPGDGRPPWLEQLENLFLTDSVDDVLSTLPREFGLRVEADAPLPGAGSGGQGPLRQRIRADRLESQGPGPSRIELWIDPASRLVERMELHWSDVPGHDPRAQRRVPWRRPPECWPRCGSGAGPDPQDPSLGEPTPMDPAAGSWRGGKIGPVWTFDGPLKRPLDGALGDGSGWEPEREPGWARDRALPRIGGPGQRPAVDGEPAGGDRPRRGGRGERRSGPPSGPPEPWGPAPPGSQVEPARRWGPTGAGPPGAGPVRPSEIGTPEGAPPPLLAAPSARPPRGGHALPRPRLIAFELVERQPFPDGWFTPELHASPLGEQRQERRGGRSSDQSAGEREQ